MRRTTTFRIIRQPFVFVLVPPIQPERDPVTILLVDGGEFIERVAPRTQQDRLRSPPRPMRRIVLVDFLEPLPLRLRQRLDKFRGFSHAPHSTSFLLLYYLPHSDYQ